MPTAILRILKANSRRANHLTVTDVESVVHEKAKTMEEALIDNLADSYQKQDRKLSISSARKKAKSQIDKLENRVCGKDLISSLSQWCQQNYKVSLSPVKLAQNLEASEIDSEVKKILESIERAQAFDTTKKVASK